MATSAVAGFNAAIAISTDGGSTYNDLAEQADVTLTVEGDQIDVSNFDSSGTREFIQGLYQWSVSANGNFIDGDTAQDAVFSNITANTSVDVRVRPVGETSGDVEYTGPIMLSSWEVNTPMDGQASFSFEGQGNGALSKASQP